MKTKWQPIESAPETISVLVCRGSNVFVAHFINGLWLSEPGLYAIQPTHWMPLPEPPKQNERLD